MKHKLSKIQCLALHWDDDGNPLPQCLMCEACGEFVNADQFNVEECKGRKRGSDENKMGM